MNWKINWRHSSVSSLSTAERNSLWAQALMEQLYRLGVGHVCLSPGSRNTPLVLATEDHPRLQSVVHFDERGAAFLALGLAKATATPAALICTSGTAAANCLPAVVEANLDHVPLVVLTADRPAELLGCGANQTIDQRGIYHRQVRFENDFQPPGETASMAAQLPVVAAAMACCCGWPAGPVHLNCRFREPFVPDAPVQLADYPALHSRLAAKPLPAARPDSGDLDAVHHLATASDRGLLVVGSIRAATERAAAKTICQALGWPVIADIQSGLPDVANRIPAADLLLRSAGFREALAPDAVLLVGGRLTSKRLAAWLGDGSFPILQVGLEPLSGVPVPDRVHRVTRSLRDAADMVDLLQPRASQLAAAAAALSGTAGDVVKEVLGAVSTLCDQVVVQRLTERLDETQALFVGNSLPIRQLELYGGPRPVVCNRGASGIDGNLATAAGYALGTDRPIGALLGDLAALHDLNSLALWQWLPAPSVIVVINNRGGGIFHFLPGITESPHFERDFAAAHKLDFAGAAGMFGLEYCTAASPAELDSALQEAFDGQANAIVEVMVDRRATRRVDEQVTAQICSALRREIDAGRQFD